jgi:hypothetical protein
MVLYWIEDFLDYNINYPKIFGIKFGRPITISFRGKFKKLKPSLS